MSPGLETLLRLGGTVGIFAIMALWELAAPYRELQASKLDRWTRNLTLVTLSTLAVRLVLPAGAVTVAWVADQRGWGLLRLWPPPPVIAFVGSVVLLDLVIYLQHVVFHRVPALWRLHLVHHSDVDVDVTTGDRFHPLEILISLGIKTVTVLALGPPVGAVLTFEILLNATSLFNHGNVTLPRHLEGWLRWLVVTPAMHRIHHSAELGESNRNFGFNLPWWDRLFGTYLGRSAGDPRRMPLGVERYRVADAQDLPWLIAGPLRPAPRLGREEGDRCPGPLSREERATGPGDEPEQPVWLTSE